MEGSGGRAGGSARPSRGRLAVRGGLGLLGAVLLDPAEAVEVLDLLADVGDVEEGVLLEADVDERGLHPRQDPRDAPLVDVADDAALLGLLDEDSALVGGSSSRTTAIRVWWRSLSMSILEAMEVGVYPRRAPPSRGCDSPGSRRRSREVTRRNS